VRGQDDVTLTHHRLPARKADRVSDSVPVMRRKYSCHHFPTSSQQAFFNASNRAINVGLVSGLFRSECRPAASAQHCCGGLRPVLRQQLNKSRNERAPIHSIYIRRQSGLSRGGFAIPCPVPAANGAGPSCNYDTPLRWTDGSPFRSLDSRVC